MSSKGVHDRVLLCAPTIWAAFAYSPFVGEASLRLYPAAKFIPPPSPEKPEERFLSLPQFMRANGDKLCRLRDGMVAADRALDADRRALGEEHRRRDEQAAKVYKRVVWLRDQFEDRVGKRRTTDRLRVEGDTPRDPVRLAQVARRAAEAVLDEDVFLPEPMTGAVISRRVVGETLVDDCDVLAASIEAIRGKLSGLKGAISFREDRIAEVDGHRAKLGRFLETLLVHIGMPTLAVTVRPELEGTGRRGRPAKQRDLFPDLVAAALALDPGAGLTLDEIRDRVPRKAVEYQRPEDVPSAAELERAIEREAEDFAVRGEAADPEDAGEATRLLEPEALGGAGAVDRLKKWLAGVARALRGRQD